MDQQEVIPNFLNQIRGNEVVWLIDIEPNQFKK